MTDNHKQNVCHLINAIIPLDAYILDLLDMAADLDDMKMKVAQSEMDKELEEELHKIQLRLIKEIGMRIWMLFSKEAQ